MRYKYITEYTGTSKERTWLALVTEKSCPAHLFQYLLEKLKPYSEHQFMAKWQREQFTLLLENLPEDTVILLRDFSEDYQCFSQDETKTEHFGRAKVSIHINVCFRHALDGEERKDDSTNVVKELLVSIMDDSVHNSYATHHDKGLCVKYLKSVGYPLKKIFEWTDGCSAQYKSRHCMGDISLSSSDFSVVTQRDFYETSHAKGEQDDAGSHIKCKVTMVVIRRDKDLEDMGLVGGVSNLKDMRSYLKKTFSMPQTGSSLLKRVFFYIDENEIIRQGRSFKPMKENRKLQCQINK